LAFGSAANGLCLQTAPSNLRLVYLKKFQIYGLFVRLISHQPAVLYSRNKPATSNQSAVLFSKNKSAPAISHQPNEQAIGSLLNSACVEVSGNAQLIARAS
jgi:hypothetical protein